MVTYESFLEYVSPAVPGAVEPLMIRAIRDACIDFCVESQLFQQTLEPILSIANIPDYTIETPEDTKVAMVLNAWYDGQPIEMDNQSSGSVNALSAQYGEEVVPGTPKKIIFTGGDSLILDPVPDVGGKLLVLMAALKPSRTSSTVFDQLHEDYAEAIGEGALSKLMTIKGAVFYDPNESIIKAKKFKDAVNAAMVRGNNTGLGRKSLRVKFRRI